MAGKKMKVAPFTREEIIMGLEVRVGKWYAMKDRKLFTVIIRRGVQSFNLNYEASKEECERYAHMLRMALSGRESSENTEMRDAATLIRRMAHRLKVNAEHGAFPAANLKMASQATGWLQRRGLAGSILRKE